ncbi:MAG TPA: hypothetical protein VLV83_19745 [Acidobacteriota bacterium]|nr:hypothetical protein [Acidobacteriota bacterium]
MSQIILPALSIRQPWLWAIMAGHEPIENRTWKPHRRLIGRRLVLAASASRRDWQGEWFHGVLKQLGIEAPETGSLVFGAAVGTVRVTGCDPPFDPRQQSFGADERARGPWRAPEQFGWLLADPRPFPEPIPAKGRLGIWDIEIPEDYAA